MPLKPVILFFQFDLMSHFFRSLRLANALKEDYEVYMRQTDKYAYYLEKAEIKTFNCDDFDPETSLEKLGQYDFSWLNKRGLETIFLEQVNIIKIFKPDIVIGDTSFSLKMAAEATGVPYISILNGYFTKYYKFTRELSLSHPIAPYISWLPKAVLNPIVRYKEAKKFMLILKEFNKVRLKYDLSSSSHYLEEIEGDQNIICDLPEIFPQKDDLPENFHIIGPLFNGTIKSLSFDMNRINPGKRTILVTLGSSGDWERFKFLNDDEYSNYNVIIAGNKNNVLNAPFLIKTPFVNFSELNPILDLVICHGGNGTLYNALINKTPVLCIPSHPEQHWNVKRITDLGYGQSLEKTKPKKYPFIIKKWIEKKNKIPWKLNFDLFNNEFQNNLITELTENFRLKHIK